MVGQKKSQEDMCQTIIQSLLQPKLYKTLTKISNKQLVHLNITSIHKYSFQFAIIICLFYYLLVLLFGFIFLLSSDWEFQKMYKNHNLVYKNKCAIFNKQFCQNRKIYSISCYQFVTIYSEYSQSTVLVFIWIILFHHIIQFKRLYCQGTTLFHYQQII